MNEVEQQSAPDSIEWMPWRIARIMLIARGAITPDERPELLAEWAESGNLLTRARLLFVDGQLNKNGLIPLHAWVEAREQGKRDLYSGNLDCESSHIFDGKRMMLRAREVEVSVECFRELLQLDEEDAEPMRKRLADFLGEAASPENNETVVEAPAKPPRKRGRGVNPVWAKAYAAAYSQHRRIAESLSDEKFRDWVRSRSPLGKQASPEHHRSIRRYREKAERGEFDHYLDR